MPEEAKLYGSVKRYGVRYGTKLKGKIAKIEAERHLSTKCPYCHYSKAKRIAAGIWSCSKCKSKFTGKAYTPGGHVAIKEAVETAAQTVAETAQEAAAADDFSEEDTEEEEEEQEEEN